MLTEMVEYGRKLDEKMKAMLSEIKQNVQGTNSEGQETQAQINNFGKKGRNKHSTRTEWRNRNSKKWGKAEEPLGQLYALQYPNHRGSQGEEEEQVIENLFEQIMKENFPNLAKEIDFQEVQEAQRVPKKLDPRRNASRHMYLH